MLSEAGEGNCVFVLVKAHQNEGVVNQIDSRGVNAPPSAQHGFYCESQAEEKKRSILLESGGRRKGIRGDQTKEERPHFACKCSRLTGAYSL